MASADIFKGMFSTPDQLRAKRIDELMNQRNQINQMGGSMSQLLGQVAAGGGATGAMMAELAGQTFGMKTAEEAKAEKVNSIMSGVNWMDDASVTGAVSQFVKMGEPEAALRVKEYADAERKRALDEEVSRLDKQRLTGTISDEQTAREEAARLKTAEANLAKVYKTADPKTPAGRKAIQDAIAQVDTLKAIQTGINWQNQDIAQQRNTREAASQAHRIAMDLNADKRSGAAAQLDNQLKELNIEAKQREGNMPMFKTLSVMVKKPILDFSGQPTGQFEDVNRQVTVVLNEQGQYALPAGINQELQEQLGLAVPAATPASSSDDSATSVSVRDPAAGSDPTLQGKTLTAEEKKNPRVQAEIQKQRDVSTRLNETIDDFLDPTMSKVAAATYKRFGSRTPQFDNPEWVAMVRRFFPEAYKKYKARGLL